MTARTGGCSIRANRGHGGTEHVLPELQCSIEQFGAKSHEAVDHRRGCQVHRLQTGAVHQAGPVPETAVFGLWSFLYTASPYLWAGPARIQYGPQFAATKLLFQRGCFVIASIQVYYYTSVWFPLCVFLPSRLPFIIIASEKDLLSRGASSLCSSPLVLTH